MNLGPRVQYLEVPNHNLTDEQALKRYQQGNFTQSEKETPSFGFTTSEYWLALDIKNASANNQERLLQIAYAPLDHIEIYLIAHGEILLHEIMGDNQPFTNRPTLNRNFVVPLNFLPDQRHTLLIKAHQLDGDTVEVPIQLFQANDFTQAEIKASLFDGAFIGIMIIMAIYNLFLFATFETGPT